MSAKKQTRPFHVYVAVAQNAKKAECSDRHRMSKVEGTYFKYETILVSPVATAAEVASAFLAAADLPPNFADDVKLKLTNFKDGSTLSIGPNILPNSPETRYRLYVDYGNLIHTSGLLSHSEKSKALNAVTTPKQELSATLDILKANIKSLEMSVRGMSAAKSTSIKLQKKQIKNLQSFGVAKYNFSEETKKCLRTPSFDNWQWDENEILSLLEYLFIDLGLIEEFRIEIPALRQFLLKIKESYNNNPFHNFRHCFCVSQMMYAIIHVTGVVDKLNAVDKLVLLTSCIGHDADHPGLNNAYQINAQTDLAVLYNDASPLENHHTAVLFTIVKNPDSNIFKNIPDAVYKEVRKGIIKCILATDMAKHGELMGHLKKYADSFNFDDAEQRLLLLQMIVKCADISNEVRPTDVAEPWVDCLLQEFFAQSDREKAEGLPTAPFMDRDKVTKASAQVGFIGYVMIPLYELVGKVLPGLEHAILNPIRQSLVYYKEMLEKDQKQS